MTDKQPEALRLAAWLEPRAVSIEHVKAAALLRTQHAEIEASNRNLEQLTDEVARLTAALKWEQNRAERIGTHGPGCEKWGPAHHECALRAIERKDALLRQALTLCQWIAETQHTRGSVNGLAAQIRYAAEQELSQ